MARIRGRDTKPEVVLRKALWHMGLRYRTHYRFAFGRPDLTFLGPRVVVFVDGCQWHGCPTHYVRPKTNSGFWASKLRENVERDSRQTLQFEAHDWTVVRLLEHEIFAQLDCAISQVQAAIHGENQSLDLWRTYAVEPISPAGDHERRHLVNLRDLTAKHSVEQERTTTKWRTSPVQHDRLTSDLPNSD